MHLLLLFIGRFSRVCGWAGICEGGVGGGSQSPKQFGERRGCN